MEKALFGFLPILVMLIVHKSPVIGGGVTVRLVGERGQARRLLLRDVPSGPCRTPLSAAGGSG